MTQAEFAAVMAYLAAGCGKRLEQETLQVYFDLLSDLPLLALQFAAKRALLELTYPVFPPAGTLRKLATSAMRGPDELPAQEAYGLLMKAVRLYGYNRPQEAEKALPPAVWRAADAMGWQSICASTEAEICRAQFCKTYEAIAGREQRGKLLPRTMKEFLERIGAMPEDMYTQEYDPRNAWQVLKDHGLRLILDNRSGKEVVVKLDDKDRRLE